jgi:hypothetical protein
MINLPKVNSPTPPDWDGHTGFALFRFIGFSSSGIAAGSAKAYKGIEVGR